MNITERIKQKIYRQGRGWVFTPRDFLNIRHFNTINPLLDRLENRGLIKALGKGLYYYPMINDLGKVKPPTKEAIVRALEKQLNDKFQFGGEYASYLLGVSKEKPTGVIYLSNKLRNIFHIEGHIIKINKTSIPTPANKYDKPTLIIQSLKHIGKTKVDNDLLIQLTSNIEKKELKKLRSMAKDISWINHALIGIYGNR